MKNLIPKHLHVWNNLVLLNDATAVAKPTIVKPIKISEVAAERAVKARKNPTYAKLLRKAKEKQNLDKQLAPSTTEKVLNGIGDAIDAGAGLSYFIGPYGEAFSNTYFGLKGLTNLVRTGLSQELAMTIIPATRLAKEGKATVEVLGHSPLLQDTRELFSVAKHGSEPIYTREWVESHPDLLHLKLKNGHGTVGSAAENNGTLDITDMYMNAGGNGSGADLSSPMAAGKHMIEAYEAAPHGLIFSMGMVSKEPPLSTDSYPLALKYFQQLEKQGKGMFIKTPEGNGIVSLNKLGNQSYQLANKIIEKLNSRGGNFEWIKLVELPSKVPESLLLQMPWLRDRMQKVYEFKIPSVEFIKFKNGGNI